MADAFAQHGPHPARTSRALLARAARVRSGDLEHHAVEQLEQRNLFFTWSAQEVYLSELINRARANPNAEATRLGLNLAAGLTVGEQALLSQAQEPLALNQFLTQAARTHAADMGTRNFFDHVNPSGVNASQRAQSAGYTGTAGENIGAGYTSIDNLYRAWMSVPDQRRNVLSLNTSFDSTFHYDQLGFGFVTGVTGATYTSYYAASFGNPSVGSRTRWLTGVAITDANSNNFYDVGEGATGIRVDVYSGSFAVGTPVGTYTTDAAGNYQLPLASGTYTVKFTRESDGFVATKALNVATINVKLDLRSSELAAPVIPDDYADAGDWVNAQSVTINPTTGNGSISGSLEVSADADLFKLVAAKTGATTVTLTPSAGAFTGRVRVYNASFTLIATGSAGSNPGESTLQVTFTSGLTYYILADSSSPSATGNYAVAVTAPVDPPPPTDDFADAGDWANAASFAVNPSTGSGSTTGSIESIGDSDLFTFTASQTGSSILAIVPSSGNLDARMRIYNASFTLIATGLDGSNPNHAVATITLTAGQTYFILVDPGVGATTGNYAVQIQGPTPPPPTDDFADAGEWSSAGLITVNSTTGDGAINAVINSGSDNDLFTFVAGKSGLTNIAALVTSGGMELRIRVFAANQSIMMTGTSDPNNPGNALVSLSLIQGATYYLLVDTLDGTSTGEFSVQITGPEDPLPNPVLLTPGETPVPVTVGNLPATIYLNADGAPIFAFRNTQGEWDSVDLRAATGSPQIAGDLSPYVDPKDNLLYVAARSSAGVILFKRNNAGNWSFRNLTSEIRVSRNIVSELTTFTDSNGLRQIAGRTAQGNLVTYWQTGLMLPRGWRYYYTDIFTRDLVRRNRAIPTITSEMTSYVTQKNSLNIVTQSPTGDVILFFRPGGGLATQLWNWANLTAITRAAKFVGSVTAYETSNKVVNIAGTDAAGNAWLITWRFGEGWRSVNMTSTIAGAETLQPNSVASWVNGSVGFIAGLNSAGDVVLYRFQLVNGVKTYQFAAVSAGIPDCPPITGELGIRFNAGEVSIVGSTDDSELIRFVFNPTTSTWTAENLSQLLVP